MQQKTSWIRINHAKCVDIGFLNIIIIKASNKTVSEINHKGDFKGISSVNEQYGIPTYTYHLCSGMS